MGRNYRFSSSVPSLQPSLGVQGMAGRATSRASTRRTQQNRRRSMDFVLDLKEALQDEKLGSREDNPEDVRFAFPIVEPLYKSLN